MVPDGHWTEGLCSITDSMHFKWGTLGVAFRPKSKPTRVIPALGDFLRTAKVEHLSSLVIPSIWMTSTPFDHTAEGYDAEFSHTEVGILQRGVTHRFLKDLLAERRPQSALELNCGTGEDARWLALQGLQVTATDLSNTMVELTQNKVVGLGVRCLRSGVEELDRMLPHERYDLVLSNFGGLNCLDKDALRKAAASVRRLLKPGGTFVAVVMGRFCAWETLYYLAKLRPGAAVRRWGGGPVQAPLADGIFQTTYYYGPGQFARLMRPHLQPVARMAVGAYLPPSYLDPFFSRRPRLLERMARWEDRSYGRGIPALYSDHFLVAFRRQ